MEIVTFAIVIIAALFAISSGVWVVIALVSAISKKRTAQTTYLQPSKETDNPDI